MTYAELQDYKTNFKQYGDKFNWAGLSKYMAQKTDDSTAIGTVYVKEKSLSVATSSLYTNEETSLRRA